MFRVDEVTGRGLNNIASDHQMSSTGEGAAREVPHGQVWEPSDGADPQKARRRDVAVRRAAEVVRHAGERLLPHSLTHSLTLLLRCNTIDTRVYICTHISLYTFTWRLLPVYFLLFLREKITPLGNGQRYKQAILQYLGSYKKYI